MWCAGGELGRCVMRGKRQVCCVRGQAGVWGEGQAGVWCEGTGRCVV